MSKYTCYHMFIGWKLCAQDFSGIKHNICWSLLVYSENGLKAVKGWKIPFNSMGHGGCSSQIPHFGRFRPPWLKKMKAPMSISTWERMCHRNLTSSGSYMKLFKFKHDVIGLWHCDEDRSCFGMWSSMSTVMFRDQNNWVQTSVANQWHVNLCLKKPMVEWTTPFNFCTLRRYCGWLRNPAPAGRLFMPLLS